jgi:hypothetical protein
MHDCDPLPHAQRIRLTALELSIRHHEGRPATDRIVTETAETFLAWLQPAASVTKLDIAK